METNYEFVALILIPFGGHIKGNCYIDEWLDSPEENQGNENIEISPLCSIYSFYNLIDLWEENNL